MDIALLKAMEGVGVSFSGDTLEHH